MKQLLLRGSFLRNTEWIYGVVIYTGRETKFMMNNKKSRLKNSNIQRKLNIIVISIIIILLGVCIGFSILGKWWQDNNEAVSSYINISTKGIDSIVITTLTYYILFAALIPISLYVVIEIQRLILSSFINNDLKMYYEPNDKAASVRCSSIIEELGQVEFLFSDKTGTLTSNEMALQMCGINDQVYGTMNSSISKCESLVNIIKNPKDPEFILVDRYMRLLILCNSIFPTIHKEKIIKES